VAILHIGPDTDQDTLLARIASDGLGVSYIQKGPFEFPQWSPDGTLLATICRDADQGRDICILDPIHLQPDGTASVTNITNTPDWGEYAGENAHGTMWSPDGSALVYFASIDPMARTYGQELRIIERNGWTQRTLYTFQLFRSGATGGQIAWSPDGSRLALIFDTPSSPKINHIYLIDPVDGGLADLGQVDWDPSNIEWSQDGKFLLYEAGAVVFEQDASGKEAINRDERAVWIMDVEAALNQMAPPFRLTQEKGMIGSHDWQPLP